MRGGVNDGLVEGGSASLRIGYSDLSIECLSGAERFAFAIAARLAAGIRSAFEQGSAADAAHEAPYTRLQNEESPSELCAL